jgi:hypothetical protein
LSKTGDRKLFLLEVLLVLQWLMPLLRAISLAYYEMITSRMEIMPAPAIVKTILESTNSDVARRLKSSLKSRSARQQYLMNSTRNEEESRPNLSEFCCPQRFWKRLIHPAGHLLFGKMPCPFL